jgi:SAM-dependent methyltransferase
MAELPYSEACERNREPIREVLKDFLPSEGRVLEIGSCTGQHVVFFAPTFPNLVWQPTDRQEYLPGLRARILQEGVGSILPPVELDVLNGWPDHAFDAVYSANTAHIMGLPEVEAMFSGVGRILLPGGVFCLYGPFREKDGHMAKSNERFDQSLRARDPAMGIRDLGLLEKLAASTQLSLIGRKMMPANNQILVFERHEESTDV